MRTARFLRAAAAVLLAWQAGAGLAQMGPPRPGPRCLPGNYDGGQTEMAAGLSLAGNHRFRYALSYGALDETAEGRWDSNADSVLLTSDATTPPAFTLVSRAAGTPGRLHLDLDLPPGISSQYFSALVRFADGRSTVRQFRDDGLTLELGPQDSPLSLTLLLQVVEIESQVFELGGEERDLRVRFDPNDLGKVAFAATPLRIDGDDLLLERHGRLIRYRRTSECGASE